MDQKNGLLNGTLVIKMWYLGFLEQKTKYAS
jgi:hypothetical protein